MSVAGTHVFGDYSVSCVLQGMADAAFGSEGNVLLHMKRDRGEIGQLCNGVRSRRTLGRRRSATTLVVPPIDVLAMVIVRVWIGHDACSS